MKITVTEEHIQKGERRSCGRCPIAQAIHESTGVAMEVGIASAWPANGPYKCIDLPREAQVFIDRFDRGSRVRPFTFEFPVDG